MWLFCCHDHILVPRGRDPCGQHHWSRPLAGTEAGSPRITDFRLLCAAPEIWNNNGYHRLQKCKVVHNFSSTWRKFLRSRIAIIVRQRQSLLGGSGGMPPPPSGNFYILCPQKWNFLDSEHEFPIMSVPKVIVTFQFYWYKLMPNQ